MAVSEATRVFRAARDFLLRHREDYTAAREGFRWPRPEHFNWALDWFDVIAEDNDRPALWIVEEDGTETRISFREMAERSSRVANWLREQGVQAGDRVLLMLGNQVEQWETVLAAMKLRAVVIPATTLLGPADLRDRVDRGRVRHAVVRAGETAKFDDVPGDYTRIAVGGSTPGWLSYEAAYGAAPDFTPDGRTRSDEPLMLYFTSGTTAKPKLVEHTHISYPIGHLATMYWIGLRPGDVHLNISSPGWAKHAWSSLFAPWNAEATVFVHNYTRFDAGRLLAEMERAGVTSF
jgi:acetyl-CoA synthetase